MTKRPPTFTTTGPLITALLYDGLCIFEFGIVAEIFGLPRPEMGPDWYRFASVPVEPGPLRAHGGFVLTPDAGPELLEQADLIVVPGWKGTDDGLPDDLIRRLRQAHDRGARLASICSGAFVLAATGLLDDSHITTHWRHADALQARFPKVTVDPASLYRQNGRIYTSAGSAAGIDLMIQIVRQDFGGEAANSVARRIVLPAHRDGGQAQFLERPVARRDNDGIAPLLDAIRNAPGEDWTIDRMASNCHLGTRSFQRRFTETTGTPPGEWLTGERIEAAKRLLTESHAPIADIAHRAGFGSPETLRHHFRRRLGVSPAAYRDSFRLRSC